MFVAKSQQSPSRRRQRDAQTAVQSSTDGADAAESRQRQATQATVGNCGSRIHIAPDADPGRPFEFGTFEVGTLPGLTRYILVAVDPGSLRATPARPAIRIHPNLIARRISAHRGSAPLCWSRCLR